MQPIHDPVSERLVIYLIAGVQFIKILEFMIVMPLGPDFAKSLGIPLSQLGLVGGAYTAAAAISGLVGAMFIERFDRRKALAACMSGVVLATVVCGLASNLYVMLSARVFAGLLGGPAAALALAIVSDLVPPERRGRAMGIVMSSGAIASVLGVPASLELARLGPWSWRTPFFAVAALGALIVALAFLKLPALRKHLELGSQEKGIGALSALLNLMGDPLCRLGLLTVGCGTVGMFLLIPNLPAYAQGNLGYPREELGMLYLYGGVASFLMMVLGGKSVDKFGAFQVTLVCSVVLVATMYLGFAMPQPAIGAVAIFVLLMASSAGRGVAFGTLTSQVPRPHQRAQFMSIQSSVVHVSASVGAFLSAVILSEDQGDALGGVSTLAWLSITVAAALPIMLLKVQTEVKRRGAS